MSVSDTGIISAAGGLEDAANEERCGIPTKYSKVGVCNFSSWDR